MNKHWLLGITFATSAALVNATVGVISVNLFNSGLRPESVALLKCLIALIILMLYIFLFKKTEFLNKLKNKWKEILICSFFGVFLLYTFETKAYESLDVAIVVFILFGSSMITTFILDCILEKRMLNLKEILSILLSLLGLSLIFSYNLNTHSLLGILYAVISGVGYGVFLVLSKKLEIGSCLSTLASLMMFGSLYLFIYYLFYPSEITYEQIKTTGISLLFLGILPTIGGFYFTIKALSFIKSQSVQLVELSEPIFAIIFSFIFLNQLMTTHQLIGGGMIILAIIIHEVNSKFIRERLNLLKNTL